MKFKDIINCYAYFYECDNTLYALSESEYYALTEKDLPRSMSKDLPPGYKPENQVWRTVGYRAYGKSGSKKAPRGFHKVRIDKPTGEITSGALKNYHVKVSDLHSVIKKLKDKKVGPFKNKSHDVTKDYSSKKGSTDKQKLSNRDKERLKGSQHAKRSIEHRIRDIDKELRSNKPLAKGINRKRDEKTKNLEKEKEKLIQARGSKSVASDMLAGASTYGSKKGKNFTDKSGMRKRYRGEREEYSKGGTKMKQDADAIRRQSR